MEIIYRFKKNSLQAHVIKSGSITNNKLHKYIRCDAGSITNNKPQKYTVQCRFHHYNKRYLYRRFVAGSTTITSDIYTTDSIIFEAW